MARLHLVRHAAVAGLEQRVVRGQLELGMAREADLQEAALERWLSRCRPRPERILSSDLERCARLAHRLANAFDVPLELDADLREQSMGQWEGRTWEQITAEQPELVAAYWDDYAHTRPPGGEALTDLSTRIEGWWDRNLELLLDHSTVVVTHVGVLRVLLARSLHLPLDQCLRLAPAVASHTKLLWSEAGPVLETLGERPWLAPNASEI